MASDSEIDPVALIKRVVAHHNVTDELLSGYKKHSWPLRDEIPDIVQPVGLLLFVVVAIAVVIGPLNLFLAARSKRPTRVIWTTPALSLVASLLLVVIIVLAEGFGGQGRRFTVLFLHAGERTASLIQEQVSRTGVLLRRDFALPADAVLHRASTVYPDDQTGRFDFSAAGVHGGDWFSSRSLTAQVIQHTGPSRSGIQLWRHGDRPPEVFSSVDLPLQRIYLMDKTGAVWKTDSLQAGESRTLTPATRAELLMWWRDRQALAGGLTRALFKSPGLLTGRFYAEAEPNRNYPLTTLASIRWVDDRVLVTGTMIDKEAP